MTTSMNSCGRNTCLSPAIKVRHDATSLRDDHVRGFAMDELRVQQD
jgi:hypothetical protein